MISLASRLWLRQTVPFHVQIELTNEPDSYRWPSYNDEIRGHVVRVFRSDGRLGLGDFVTFSLWVCDPGDEPTDPACVYRKAIVQATHMEVYLHDGIPPQLELAGYEFDLLNAASDEPTMCADQLNEDLPKEVPGGEDLEVKTGRKWWRFWDKLP